MFLPGNSQGTSHRKVWDEGTLYRSQSLSDTKRHLKEWQVTRLCSNFPGHLLKSSSSTLPVSVPVEMPKVWVGGTRLWTQALGAGGDAGSLPKLAPDLNYEPEWKCSWRCTPWVGRSATNTKQMLKAWETYTKNKSDTFKTRVRSRSQNRICSLPHHCFI